jgi:scyllo-inosamine-4-phosphate amidinotransferase 1
MLPAMNVPPAQSARRLDPIEEPGLTVSAHNEWDPLRSVLVGCAEGAQIPQSRDRSLHAIDYPGYPDQSFRAAPAGPYPEQVIEETAEDLERFCAQLRGAGVEVHRPPPLDLTRVDEHRGWAVDGYYNYCPRDSITVIGERVIATPMVLRHRQREAEALRALFDHEAWVACPAPRLDDELYDPQSPDGLTLRDVEPAFDAANLLRFGQDILYLVSNTGNRSGAELLGELLGPDYRVHVIADVYKDRHIDTTFLPLREGLLLVNGARVREAEIPSFLRRWEILWSPEMVPLPALEGYCPASEWIGMNLLSLSPHLAAVEEHQLPLIRALEGRGIDVMPVRLRHSRTLGGGPHCVTVDLVRG